MTRALAVLLDLVAVAALLRARRRPLPPPHVVHVHGFPQSPAEA